MFRKLIGVVTAVAAAGLLVGVAWASGDEAGNDSRSDAIALAAGSDVSSSAPQGTASGGTIDLPTSTSGEDSTSSSFDDQSTDNTVGSSTDVTIVDRSTSTSVDSTTSTIRDEDASSSTSSTIDDHSTVPITTEPRAYDVHGAGSVTVQLVAGELVLVDAGAASGWTIEVDKSDGRDIRVEFENGDSDARFEAKVRDGEVRVEIRRD